MTRGERVAAYRKEIEAGATVKEVAEKYGVTTQNVYQCIVKHNFKGFHPYNEETCVYPKLRKWLNDNKVTRKEFCVRMGIAPMSENIYRMSIYFKGINYPTKLTIDKMLKVTGLTYEELFSKEE